MKVERVPCTFFVLLLVLATLSACSATARRATNEPVAPTVEPGAFYEGLAAYGLWLWMDPHGWVWTPDRVSTSWRPYTKGSWVYTADGWTWESDWAWGWAPFHYGRWMFDENYGWVWVPRGRWAPAWVAWRTASDVIGWAPLSPDVKWSDNAGLTVAGARAQPWDAEHGITMIAWIVVSAKWFTDPLLSQHLESPALAHSVIA